MAEVSDPVELAVRLMQVDSTSGSEGECVSLVEEILRSGGWETSRIPVSPGRDDVLARSGPHAALTFSTHLDTVPPYIAPFIDGTRLYGRGACDAKGIAAAMICAAERLRAAGIDVALLFVVGEEVSHDGAIAANRVQNASKVLINGEPTESKLAVGTKGASRYVLRTAGSPAHSAYPELGRSATLQLARLLVELQELELPADPLFGRTTINIGQIAGGVADNVVAPSAEARLMARLVGPAEELTARLREWLGDRGELEAGVAVPTVKLNVVDGFETTLVAFATDIPSLANWGRPYLYGPGSIHVAHRHEEFIDIGELRAAVAEYERLGRGALAGEHADPRYIPGS